MRTLIAIALAAVAFSASSQEVAKPKKTSQAEMLAIVCTSKAVKSAKLQAACDDATKLQGLQLTSTVTIKAPNAELKILYANREFFK